MKRLFLIPLLAACYAGGEPAILLPFSVEAQAWPEADALFRTDPRWLGADGAYSADLGGGRTLWLFGDSFVDPAARGDRRRSVLVRNSVAIMDGADPAAATIDFYWGGEADAPASFFPEDGDDWFWPANAIRVGDTLTVFLMRTRFRPSDSIFRFESRGWDAVRIDNPDDPPDLWTPRFLAAPAPPFPLLVGQSLFVRDGFVHAYAVREPGDHHVFLARWPEAAFAAGDLSGLEWWNGGWGAAAPAPLFDAQSEFTVVHHVFTGGYLAAFSRGFGATTLALRIADRPEGPWSGPGVVYEPPESLRPDLFVYAGKAHAHLEGADLVCTYAANGWEFATVLDDDTVYYPRFVRLTFR